MRKQSINKTEEMYLQIPFHAWIDGDMEILKFRNIKKYQKMKITTLQAY